MSRRLDPTLVRALAVLRPYLGDIVLAGGWVPSVYQLMHDTSGTAVSPHTRDIDLAVARRVPVRDGSIDTLLKQASFECRFHSLDSPPVTKYVAGEPGEELEIEFITDAPGRREAVVSVQPDLTAQELHYVGLLLMRPWRVCLGPLSDGAIDGELQIPSPGAFVFHKALAHRDRTDRAKRDKDLYYIFFVMDAFPDWHPLVQAELERFAASHQAWFRKAKRDLALLFADPVAAGVDALVSQRPRTAFPEMDDDRFRQYAFDVMHGLAKMMDRD